jgi:hypothetical protein
VKAIALLRIEKIGIDTMYYKGAFDRLPLLWWFKRLGVRSRDWKVALFAVPSCHDETLRYTISTTNFSLTRGKVKGYHALQVNRFQAIRIILFAPQPRTDKDLHLSTTTQQYHTTQQWHLHHLTNHSPTSIPPASYGAQQKKNNHNQRLPLHLTRKLSPFLPQRMRQSHRPHPRSLEKKRQRRSL